MEQIGSPTIHHIIKELLLQYNNMVKDGRTHYFSEHFSAHHRNRTFLFKTVDQLVGLNPVTPGAPVECDARDFYLNLLIK